MASAENCERDAERAERWAEDLERKLGTLRRLRQQGRSKVSRSSGRGAHTARSGEWLGLRNEDAFSGGDEEATGWIRQHLGSSPFGLGHKAGR